MAENTLLPSILAGLMGLAVFSVGFLMQRCSAILALHGQHPAGHPLIEALLELLKIALFIAGTWCALAAIIFFVNHRWMSCKVSVGLSAMAFTATIVVWRRIMRAAKRQRAS